MLIAVGLLVACSVAAQETKSSGVKQLVKKLAPYERVSFSFQQTLFGAAGEMLDHVFGKAVIARPNQIRWEILRPYPQLVVSDGEVVWFYDPDLLQATRRPATYDSTSSVALILLGNATQINEYFTVELPAITDKYQTFTLKPKDSDVGYFKHIKLLFYGDKINEMTILDHNQQETIFIISRLKINLRIARSAFQFTPPKGVDVSYETRAQ